MIAKIYRSRSLSVFITFMFAGCAPHFTIKKSEHEISEPRKMSSLVVLENSDLPSVVYALVSGGFLGDKPDQQVSNTLDLIQVDKHSGAVLSVERSPTKMKLPRWGHKSVLVNNTSILMCGGSTEKTCELLLLKPQEPKQPTFASAKAESPSLVHQKGPTLSEPRSGLEMLPLKSGKVLVTGGYLKSVDKKSTPVSTAEIYDPLTQSIQILKPMVFPRAGHTLVENNLGVFVLGGTTSETALIEKYDEKLGFQKTSLRLPTALKDFKIISQGETVYVFGGTYPNGESTPQILKVDFKNNSVVPLKASLSEAREDMSLCIFSEGKGSVVLMGGEIKGAEAKKRVRGNHSDTVDVFFLSDETSIRAKNSLFLDDGNTLNLKNHCILFGGTNELDQAIRSILTVEKIKEREY